MTEASFKAGKKILIADDEPHILLTLGDLLEEQGYLVVKAPDGKLALEYSKKTLPDLIILDVNMPKMSGFDVLDQLKKDIKTMDIPVIMLTVKNAAGDIAQGILSYAEKYVTKPFEPEVLLREVEQSLKFRFSK